MIDPPTPAILRRAAERATFDARAAWKAARTTPDEARTRAAFRQCVLAARMVRRAASTLPDGDERRRMIKNADQVKAAADDLKARLARIIEGDGMEASEGTEGGDAGGSRPGDAGEAG